ncbi:MAG: serine protease [Candidatus Nanopelagicales bacterium]
MESTPQTRVVGGKQANRATTPWFVFLEIHISVSEEDEDVYTCGGTAISQRWVLTAAHCVANATTDDIKNSLLSVNPKTDTLTSPIGFEKAIIHPSYNPNRLAANDIALIKTTKPMNTTVASYSGNAKGPTTGTALDVYGFGVTGPPKYLTSKYLRTARVRNLGNPSGICKSWSGVNPKTLICAGMSKKPVGACQGDSGGPLMSTYLSKRRIVVGVVNGGNSVCTTVAYPGLFAKTSAYASWIKRQTGVAPSYARVNKPAILEVNKPCKTKVCKRKRGQALTITIKNVGNETGRWKVQAKGFAKLRSARLAASKSTKVRYKVTTRAKRCVTVRVQSGKKTVRKFKLAVNNPRQCR